MDAGSFPPGPRVRSGPWRPAFRDQEKGVPDAGGTGGAAGDPRPCPFPRPRSGPGRRAWERPGSRPAVPAQTQGRAFPAATKGPEGGPGRWADGGAGWGVFRPAPETALCRVGSPRASGALTVQGQEVPAQVHARRAPRRAAGSAAGAGRRGTPGGLGSERCTGRCGGTAGGRSRARPAPAPPRPLLVTREGGQGWGLGSPPNAGPGRRGTPWPEIAGSLGGCHPQAAGPVISSGGRAPRPACGAAPRGVWGEAPKPLASCWERDRAHPTPSLAAAKGSLRGQASSRGWPQVCCPFCQMGAGVPRSSGRKACTLSGGGPAPRRGEAANPRSDFGGGCGERKKAHSKPARGPTFETPVLELRAICAAAWLTGVGSGIG